MSGIKIAAGVLIVAIVALGGLIYIDYPAVRPIRDLLPFEKTVVVISGPENPEGVAKQFFDSINNNRHIYDVNPVQWDPGTANQAIGEVNSVASSGGRDLMNVYAQNTFAITKEKWNEGRSAYKKILDDLMNDKIYRINVLERKFNRIGIGVAETPNMYYVKIRFSS